MLWRWLKDRYTPIHALLIVFRYIRGGGNSYGGSLYPEASLWLMTMRGFVCGLVMTSLVIHRMVLLWARNDTIGMFITKSSTQGGIAR